MHSPQTNALVRVDDLRGKRRMEAELLALACIAIVAKVAIATGAPGDGRWRDGSTWSVKDLLAEVLGEKEAA